MFWSEVGPWALGIAIFFVVLLVSIGLHEAGHMVVAKAFKLNVPRFFVGFGPTLFSRKKKGTEYGVKAIPLGGFVIIEDETVEKPDFAEIDEKLEGDALPNKQRNELEKKRRKLQERYEMKKSLLSNVSPWKRILVFLAGPAVNLVLGFVILSCVMMLIPSHYVSQTVESVNSCAHLDAGDVCGAERGGMLPGDVVQTVNGVKISQTNQISDAVHGASAASVVVLRDGAQRTLQVPVEGDRLGINLKIDERTASLGETTDALGGFMVHSFEAIGQMPSKVPGLVTNILGTSKPDPEAPGSIIVVGKTYGETTASSVITTENKVRLMLTYSGMLNIGLGLLNLIPILPLDGGRVLIAVMDSVKIGFSKLRQKRYSPVSLRTTLAMNAVMLPVVFGFMLLVIISDSVNIGRSFM